MPPLIIHHIEGRRSERIVWLCEELGLPYDLRFKLGDPPGSARMARDANALMPMFPTVIFDGEVLVESAAVLQLLHENYGEGRLAPPVSSPEYPKYLQWLHFAEGSAAPRFITEFLLKKGVQGEPPPIVKSQIGRSAQALRYLDDHLSRESYFGGHQFSLADIMMHFPINFIFMVGGAALSDYPNIARWIPSVEQRPAFERMREISLPNGFIAVPS
jgi:glutathione S-transferase